MNIDNPTLNVDPEIRSLPLYKNEKVSVENITPDFYNKNSSLCNQQPYQMMYGITGFRHQFGLLRSPPKYSIEKALLSNTEQDHFFDSSQCRFHEINNLKSFHYQLQHNVICMSSWDVIYCSNGTICHYDMRTAKTRQTNHIGCDIQNIDALDNLVCSIQDRTDTLKFYDFSYDYRSNESLTSYDNPSTQRPKLLCTKKFDNMKNYGYCKFIKQENHTKTTLMALGNGKDIDFFDVGRLMESDQAYLEKPTRSIHTSFAQNHASVNASNNLVLAASDCTKCHIYDIRKRKIVMELEGHQDHNFATDWSSDERYCVTGGQDMSAIVWDIRNSATPLRKIPCKKTAVASTRFIGNSNHKIYIAERYNNIRLVEMYNKNSDIYDINYYGNTVGCDFNKTNRIFLGLENESSSGLLELTLKMNSNVFDF